MKNLNSVKKLHTNYHGFKAVTLVLLLNLTPHASAQNLSDMLGLDKVGEEINSAIKGGIEDLMKELGDFVEGGDDEKTLKTYSRTKSYMWEGAVTGVLVGVGTNCVNNVVQGGGCLDKAALAAAIGGGLGATGGYLAATQQRELADESSILEQQTNSARLELEQAKLNREAAERIVTGLVAEIAETRSTLAEDKKAKKKLKKLIKDADKKLEMLNNAKARMESEISVIDGLIENEKNEQAKLDFAEVKSNMEAEKTLLSKQIDILGDAITTEEV